MPLHFLANIRGREWRGLDAHYKMLPDTPENSEKISHYKKPPDAGFFILHEYSIGDALSMELFHDTQPICVLGTKEGTHNEREIAARTLAFRCPSDGLHYSHTCSGTLLDGLPETSKRVLMINGRNSTVTFTIEERHLKRPPVKAFTPKASISLPDIIYTMESSGRSPITTDPRELFVVKSQKAIDLERRAEEAFAQFEAAQQELLIPRENDPVLVHKILYRTIDKKRHVAVFTNQR